MVSVTESATIDIGKSIVKDGSVVLLSGRFITEHIKQLEMKFYTILQNIEKGKRLFLNLCSVTIIDSRGISFIVGLYKECLLKNITLVIMASSDVYAILHQIKLDLMIPVQEVV